MPGRSRFNELGEASDGRRWRETPPLAPPLAPRSIFGGRMKFSFVRLVATLLLSGQMLPVGLPLLCEQVQRGTAANCEQQMASHPFGPVVDARTHTSPCANPALGQGSAAPVAGDSGLQSLVAEALDRNPTVAQRQAAVRAANLRIRPAGTLPDPMLTVGVMDLLLPHFEFNRSDFTEVDVELSQEIPWPGSLGARSGVVRAAAAGARAEEGTVRRELTTAMAVAYYRLGCTVTPLPPPAPPAALALAAHPRLAGRRAAVEQATRTIQVARLGARPDFTLTARYGYRPPYAGTFKFPDFFSAFLGLRVPIWAWRKQNRLADAARADSTGAAAGLREAELQLSREVTEAAARVEALQQRLALLVDGVLPNARGTVESVLRSYQVGRAEFLTLLSVEDARYRAELEAVAVAADYQAQLVMLRQLTAGETQP